MSPDNDWVDDFSGNVDQIGPNPYGLSATQPGNTMGNSQSSASPLSGLAAALNKYGGSGYADPQSQQPFPANQQAPGYTDPLAIVPDYANLG